MIIGWKQNPSALQGFSPESQGVHYIFLVFPNTFMYNVWGLILPYYDWIAHSLLEVFLLYMLQAVHKNQLRTLLGHPDNFLQLDALCQEEIKRQQAQADGIRLHTQMLQVDVKLTMSLGVADGEEKRPICTVLPIKSKLEISKA